MSPRPGKRLSTLAFALLTLLLAGCEFLSPTPMAWALTTTPAITPSVAPSSIPPSSVNVPPTLSPTRKSNTPDPNKKPDSWLVYLRSDTRTIVAQHPDGTGKEEITLPDPVLYPADLQQGASPQGDWLAVRTGLRNLDRLSLALIQLDGAKIVTHLPLLSDVIQNAIPENPSDPLPEPVTAVTQADSLGWSPNGRYLAFIGASSGPSADLYLYDRSTGETRRLTSGVYQAINPAWSPDSLWVLTSDVVSFNATSGWRLAFVWATAADHNELRRLYTPPANSTSEHLMGWLGSDQAAMYTQAPDAAREARLVPVSARRIDRLYAGPAVAMAFDPATSTVAFTEDDLTGRQLGLAPGLYQVIGSQGAPKLVQAGEWKNLVWSRSARRFFATGASGVLGFDGAGHVDLYEGETYMSVAPNGLWLLGWGGLDSAQPGMRLYQPGGQALQVVTSDPVQQVTWQKDAKAFYFLSAGKLYRAAFPQAQPQSLDQDIVPGSLGWVGTALP